MSSVWRIAAEYDFKALACQTKLNEDMAMFPHLAEVLLLLALLPVLPQHDVAEVECHEPGEVLPVGAVTVEQAEEVQPLVTLVVQHDAESVLEVDSHIKLQTIFSIFEFKGIFAPPFFP